MNKRICVLTAGHLATCPRMLKAADAFADAGCRVRVVSTRFSDWAWEADLEIRKTRTWDWSVVDCRRSSSRWNHLRTGLAHRAAGACTRAMTVERAPMPLVRTAYGRMHGPLVRAALESPCDLLYAGTNGALGAAAVASKRSGTPYALDLEDFHSGEHADGSEGAWRHSLAARLERQILPAARFLTAGSEAIAEQYRRKYAVDARAIHNVASLPERQPSFESQPGVLRTYWFSQTIGPERGVDHSISALGRLGAPCVLHLRGVRREDYWTRLEHLVSSEARNVELKHLPPAPPGRMIDLAADYDVGFAVEPGFSLNNRIALSNKAFTYMAAGLAVAMSATEGQRPLGEDLGQGAALFEPGDVEGLAAALRRWAEDPAALLAARRAAYAAARRRWHWEHDLERGALLRLMEQALAG